MKKLTLCVCLLLRMMCLALPLALAAPLHAVQLLESSTVATSVDPGVYDDYVGQYAYAILTVTREGDRVFAQMTGEPKLEIFPKSETEFFWKVADAEVEFIKDDEGKVTHALHDQDGIELTAPKIDDADVDSDIVGQYAYLILTITREGDRLFAQWTAQEAFEIFPKSETEFFWKVVDAQVTFVRNEAGMVTHARHHSQIGEFEAPKIEPDLIRTSARSSAGPNPVYESFRMNAGSMMPTLLDGDTIIVDKTAYDTTASKGPNRGDVVVFRHPDDPATPWLMRVVGIPGDRIGYYDKTLHINGKPVERTHLGPYQGVGSGADMTGASVYEERLEGAAYNILVEPDRSSIEGETVVPENHYFVLGDNRDNSRDSRYWGTVPGDYLIGKVVSRPN